MLEFKRLDGFKVANIFRVGTGPTTLDVSHTQIIEQACNLQFIRQRKGYALSLRSIAERCVIDCDIPTSISFIRLLLQYAQHVSLQNLEYRYPN